jgi:HK97 family phage portal protein
MGRFATAARELRYARFVVTDPRNPAYWVQSLFGMQNQSAAGVNVTDGVALGIATVYASSRNLGEDVGGLPTHIFEKSTGGRRQALEHPAWDLFNGQANGEMSSMAFKEALTGHAALRGTGYAEIQWDGALRPLALWPLNPARVQRVRNGRNGVDITGLADGELAYRVGLPDGQVRILIARDVLPIHGFSPDGVNGYSVLALARESIGLAAAAQEFGGRFFGNDARPGLYLKSAKALSEPARKNLKESWDAEHRGLENAQRIAILEEGIDVGTIGIPPEDAQFLQTRQFQREDIQAWFRMPPSKVMDLSHGTYANVEQDDISYSKWTLRAWTSRWDQQLTVSRLVTPPFYAETNLAAAMAGDAKSRGEFYGLLRNAGAITSNQIADRENFPRSDAPGADELWYQVNTLPASAFDDHGMTLGQRAHAAFELLRAGYEATAVNALLGFGDLAHTGVIPGTTTPDPSEQTGGTP